MNISNAFANNNVLYASTDKKIDVTQQSSQLDNQLEITKIKIIDKQNLHSNLDKPNSNIEITIAHDNFVIKDSSTDAVIKTIINLRT